MLKKQRFARVEVYNGRPSRGDPYGVFGSRSDLLATAAERLYFSLAQLLYFLSLRRCIIGSSIVVFCEK